MRQSFKNLISDFFFFLQIISFIRPAEAYGNSVELQWLIDKLATINSQLFWWPDFFQKKKKKKYKLVQIKFFFFFSYLTVNSIFLGCGQNEKFKDVILGIGKLIAISFNKLKTMNITVSPTFRLS